MSTQPTNTDKEKEKTLPQTTAPPQGFSPPPRPKSGRWPVIATVIIALAIILSGGAIVLAVMVQRQAVHVTPTPIPTTIPGTPGATATITPTPVPGVVLGPQACPAPVKDPSYWEKIVSTQSGINHVASVSCANIMNMPSLQALVTVRSISPDAIVDVYVFNNITSAKPAQIFKLQGLLKGDVKISGYNTVMTAEVDKNSALNAGKTTSAMTTDLFREFDWSGEQGTLVQTVFPGFFPDLTRYQAEKDQSIVNVRRTDTWKLDALETTKRFAQALLRTPPDSAVTLVSGGGVHDVDAIVNVTPPVLPGCCGPFPPIKVTLSRLEGNTNSGIWIVVGVESGQKAITAPQKGDHLNSPVTVKGSGSQFESQVGIVHVLDHLYTDIGHSIAKGTSGLGSGPFSVSVSYEASFHGGAQEGIVVLYDENGGGASLRGGVAMVKVLLD